MGNINLTIEDQLEKDFRDKAFEVFGPKQGFLQDAVEEAFLMWLKAKGTKN